MKVWVEALGHPSLASKSFGGVLPESEVARVGDASCPTVRKHQILQVSSLSPIATAIFTRVSPGLKGSRGLPLHPPRRGLCPPLGGKPAAALTGTGSLPVPEPLLVTGTSQGRPGSAGPRVLAAASFS